MTDPQPPGRMSGPAVEDPGEARRLRGNIARFYLWSIFSSFQLWIAIWVVYLQQERGLSLAQVATLDVAFWLVMVSSEVPTGGLADRYGRRRVLIASTALLVVAIGVFGLAENLWVLGASYVFWGFSMTLASGADSAFLYDTLAGLGRAHEFTKYSGRWNAIVTVAFMAGALLGAPLASVTSLGFPILLSAVLTIPAVVIAWTMVEPPHREEAPHNDYLRTIREASALVWRVQPVRWLVLVRATILTVDMWVVIFQQPFLIAHGVAVSALGWWQAVLRLFLIGGALYAHRAIRRLGEQWTLSVLGLATLAGVIVLTGVPHLAAFTGFVLIGLAQIMLRPLFADYLSRHSPQHLRATVMSVAQVMSSLLIAFSEPAMGALADRFSLETAFGFGAACFVLLWTPAMLAWHRAERRLVVSPAHAHPAEALASD